MPVILADIGGLFAIGFLLISFIGWIINLINAQNPPQAPNRGPQRRPRARDGKVQNEIEQFLQEAMGKQRGQAEEVSADDIEILEPAPRRRPPKRPRPQSRPVAPSQRQAAAPPKQRSKPGSDIQSRHMQTSDDLGTGITSHVQDHMGKRVGKGIAQNLPHAIDQGVAQHLGSFTAGDRDTRASVRPVHHSRAKIDDPTGLITDLRNLRGMRKAILLQEILAKPRALRK